MLLVSVCLPRYLGRLGVPNLEVRNMSMLLRWWCCLYEEINSLWSLMVMQIRRKGTHSEGTQAMGGSFFLEAIVEDQPLLSMEYTMENWDWGVYFLLV